MFFLSLYPPLESLADYSINQYVAKHNYSLNDCVWCDYFSEIWKREPYSVVVTWVIFNKSFEVLENSKKVMKSFAQAFSMGLYYIAETPVFFRFHKGF